MSSTFEVLNQGFVAMVKSLLTIAALTVVLIASTTGADAYWYHHWHYWHPHYYYHHYYWHPHYWHRWWW